jgi:small GTP-binding protein
MAQDLPKCVLLGDGAVGKSALLLTFTRHAFPSDYTPTLVPGEVMSEGKNKLMLLDTPGQREYKKLRMLSFKNTKVFVLLFAIDNKVSFDNVEDVWFKEIREFDAQGKIPFMIVATKKDQRDNAGQSGACIGTSEGKKRAEQLGAAHYLEVSAKNNGEGVSSVFDTALTLATTPYTPKKKGSCVIL